MAYSNQRNKADDDQRKSTATKKLRFLNNSNKGRKVDDDQSHNWGEILPEILQLVQSKLRFVDIVRSKSVCSWWNVGLKLPLVPWLLLPQSDESEEEEEEEEEEERCSYILRTFFRLGDHNYYDIKNMNPGKCIGSSCGLVVWEKEDPDPLSLVRGGEAYILDPLSLAQIKLPLFPTLNPHLEWPDIKIVLSSGNPRDGVAIIMCPENLSSTELFFCKIGDSRWHKLDGQFKEYFDIICHDNFLYALSYEDSIEVWDLSKSSPVKCKIIEPSRSIIETNLAWDLYFFQNYLVQSCGNLLLVVRMVGNFVDARGKAVRRTLDSMNPSIQPYRTLMFHVYKLDSSEENWVEVEDLNNEVLFLGGNHSVSVSAKDLPPGCGTNVIYFTDDNLVLLEHIDNYGGHDLGMFSLQNKIVKHFSNKCRSKRIWPPPLWIVPNPMRN